MTNIRELKKIVLNAGIGVGLLLLALEAPLFAQTSENSTGGNPAMTCLSQIVSQGNSCEPDRMQELRDCLSFSLPSGPASIPENIQEQATQLMEACEECNGTRTLQSDTQLVSFEGGPADEYPREFRHAAAGPSREAIERRFPQLDRWIEEFEKVYPSLRNRPGIRPEYFDDMRDYHRRLQEIRNAIRQNPQNPERACELIDRHNQLEMERMQRQLQDTERELNELSREVERRRDEVPRLRQRYERFTGILILPGSDTERAYNEAYDAYRRAFWGYNEILGLQNGLTARKREQEQRLQQARERLRSCEVYLRP